MKSPSPCIHCAFAACLAFAALAAFPAPANSDQVEYTAYYFKDNSGNKVATTSFSLAKTLWSRTMVLLDIELDQLTLPPLDAVSGASRPRRQSNREFSKSRGQIIAGLEQGLGGNTKVAASYYFSQEVDYLSHSFVGSFTQELFDKNLTVSLRGQYTLDSVGEIGLDGAIQNRLKETHQASLTVTQLLTQTTMLRLGGDGMRNQGFLSDPYRTVVLPGPGLSGNVTLQEHHPFERWRQAAWGELSQYLRGLEGSVILSYRFYWDDWGMHSHTAQAKLNKYVTPDWIFSPEYRYYAQNGASFFREGNKGEFYTGDYKLKPFESNNVGLGLTWFPRAIAKQRPSLEFLGSTSLSLMYFHYFNNAESGDFTANVVETRVKFEF